MSAYQLSIIKAPAIAAWFATLATGATIIAVAFSPTHLRWKFACALFLLVLPTDSENFGVSLYAFWWAGLLLVLALLWTQGRLSLRLFYTVLGGLSSPLVLPVSVAMVARAALQRSREETITAAVAAICAAIQTYLILTTSAPSPFPIPDWSWPGLLVAKFPGFFASAGIADDAVAIFIGVGVLFLVGTASFSTRTYSDRHFLALCFLFSASCAMSVARAPLEAIHPYWAGPRYFFYPYIFLGWGLIWLAAESRAYFRFALIACLVVSIAQAVPHMVRRHTPIDWPTAVRACARSETPSELPLHFAGKPEFMWGVILTGQQCRTLLAQSVFRVGSRLP